MAELSTTNTIDRESKEKATIYLDTLDRKVVQVPEGGIPLFEVVELYYYTVISQAIQECSSPVRAGTPLRQPTR